VNGTYTKTLGTLQASRAYQFGYSESWFTDEDFSSVSGGISVTFTEVPAPGAAALLGAAGLLGSRRRR
jgi:MYXO-CTERM domain-containing protein